MQQRYEYKFVRLEEFNIGPKWLGWPTLATQKALRGYPDVIHSHAKEGWRLVQVFTPGTGTAGHAGYIELIFERPFDPSPEAAKNEAESAGKI